MKFKITLMSMKKVIVQVHRYVVGGSDRATRAASCGDWEYRPCLPTISATCSEEGTGTHSVMFCDFLARSSGGGAKPSGLASGLLVGSASPKFSMLSSSASWKARWSSTSPPPPSSPNRLDGISTCDAILSVNERFPSRVTGV